MHRCQEAGALQGAAHALVQPKPNSSAEYSPWHRTMPSVEPKLISSYTLWGLETAVEHAELGCA